MIFYKMSQKRTFGLLLHGFFPVQAVFPLRPAYLIRNATGAFTGLTQGSSHLE